MASWSSVNAFFEWMTTTPNNNEACVLHAPCESHFAKHGHCSGRLPHGQRLGRIFDGLAAQKRALATSSRPALAVCERRTRTRRHCSSARGRFLAAANQGMAWHACGASRTVNNFLLHLECAASLNATIGPTALSARGGRMRAGEKWKRPRPDTPDRGERAFARQNVGRVEHSRTRALRLGRWKNVFNV